MIIHTSKQDNDEKNKSAKKMCETRDEKKTNRFLAIKVHEMLDTAFSCSN